MPDITEPLYRFEMADDAGCIGVGMFDGIYEIGLSEEETEYIERLFLDLPFPICSKPCVFWFTQKGMTAFRNAIWYVMDVVSAAGCLLVMAVTNCPASMNDVIYQDTYQIAFRIEHRTDRPEDYKPVTSERLNAIIGK